MLASANDAVDLQLGVPLTVTLMLLIMLAPPHLEDLDFLAASMGEHGGLDRRTGQRRLSETHSIAIAHHQYLIQSDLRAHVRQYLFYLEFFAGGNPILLASGLDDRVHGSSTQSRGKQ